MKKTRNAWRTGIPGFSLPPNLTKGSPEPLAARWRGPLLRSGARQQWAQDGLKLLLSPTSQCGWPLATFQQRFQMLA